MQNNKMGSFRSVPRDTLPVDLRFLFVPEQIYIYTLHTNSGGCPMFCEYVCIFYTCVSYNTFIAEP